jgi:hypothetical protein
MSSEDIVIYSKTSLCGHLSVPRSFFCWKLSSWMWTLFSVSSAVNNLWKVGICWSSPYFFHSVKVDMHIPEQKSFVLFVFMLSYFALTLLPSRDMTWKFYFSMVYRSYWNKTHVTSLLGNKVDTTYDIIKIKRRERIFSRCICALVWLVWQVRYKDHRINRRIDEPETEHKKKDKRDRYKR